LGKQKVRWEDKKGRWAVLLAREQRACDNQPATRREERKDKDIARKQNGFSCTMEDMTKIEFIQTRSA